MAPDAGTKSKAGGKVNKDFNNLSFRYKRAGGPDNELLSLVKEVTKLPEFKDDLPTSAARKFLKWAARLVTGKAENTDIEFFERYLRLAKSQTGAQG